ncbi:ATP-binding cassette domain-containing protein [uncultured Legionella sp.]|uniref:ATP-binding cassette domain-containing protein n=1 Tax=uncultured Legionella sp. TaxID=210934 RepID=UPI002632F95F|nr:ATP-binding cassette domain-containing protein [uncultured Legionella sp.]
MTRLIQLVDLSLYFSNKICFEAFTHNIHFGDRIALIGDNGSGKSSMLKIINKLMPPSDGSVFYSNNPSVAYVPQLIIDSNISGAERFNQALTSALSKSPDVLLLDEPTNHLDAKNRYSLMRLLEQYSGTLIIASHDVQLLRQNEYCFWQFHQNKITVFQGQFAHLQQQNTKNRQTIELEISQLRQQKKQNHQALMQEQHRAKKSRLKGEKSLHQAKWPTIVSKSKVLRAQETSGKKKKALTENKEQLLNRLKELSVEEDITPHFELKGSINSSKALVTIRGGSITYNTNPILENINLNITSTSRIALIGLNGSGKSTLAKGIMNDNNMVREGFWLTPARKDIGYLDQHYQQLIEHDTVLETLQKSRPDWNHLELRKHLNDFLFRNNGEVNSRVSMLSGGEKARLSLAQIAANPPKLLILDEITNNLDLKTRAHVITLLNKYPAPFIVISHDSDFLEHIGINEYYNT